MPSTLFTPCPLGPITVPNRIAVAPMCQYMAQDGVPNDWHLVHLGQFAQSGAGLICTEATGVEPEGRITPGCTGLWNDEQEAAWARILTFCRSVGPAKLGIQLAHAGRKASTLPPWEGAGPVPEGQGSWQTVSASAEAYLPHWNTPMALDVVGIAQVIEAFRKSAERSARAGFDFIEIHAAHGYLLHQFLSSLSNKRTDNYGGSLDNRMRLTLEVFEAVRAAFPSDRAVMLRFSASDWAEGGWDLAQSVLLSRALRELGCDMLHVSSGGLTNEQKIVPGPGYQVEFAATIRREADVPVMAVGQITEALQAETIVRSGQADMVSLARGMLWNPRWAWHAAAELGEDLSLPAPYARANPALRGKPFITRK